MDALLIPDPAEQPFFQTYKACQELLVGPVESAAFPGGLQPVRAPLGSAKTATALGRIESEAYCRANNLLVFSCSGQQILACWGQAGVCILQAPGNNSQESWSSTHCQHICNEPTLSVVSASSSSTTGDCRLIFSLADGRLGLALLRPDSAGLPCTTQVVFGGVPGHAQDRVWLSSAIHAAEASATSVLAFCMMRKDGKEVVELFASQLILTDAGLSVETQASWTGKALPRASYWSNDCTALVVAMGVFETASAHSATEAMEIDGAGSDAQESKREAWEEPCDATLTTLSLSSPKVISTILPRGELLDAYRSNVPGSGITLLLDSGMDAIALHIALQEADGEMRPRLVHPPSRLTGISSVASARRSLRLCVYSPQGTFVALCETTGTEAISVFRTPTEGESVAPTCRVALEEEEEVLGALFVDDSAFILTPLRLLRLKLDTNLQIGAKYQQTAVGKLPGGVDAAALLKMLDKMED